MTETIQVENTSNRLVRRLAFLITLIIILIVVNLLYQPAANWNTIQTGAAGELIYSAGFDGFTDEWQQFDGRRLAQIQDGVLQLGLEIPDTIYSASAPVYADFDVSVMMHSVEGELTNDGYGIIFRLNENNSSEGCSRQFVIVCNLEQLPLLDTAIGLIAPSSQNQANGYYLFLISNDGYYQILRGNDETDLVEEVTIWHYSNGLLNEGIGAENRIRIVGQGNQFMFFLNGEPALLCIPLDGQQPTGNADDCLGEETFVWQDDSFAQGKLGVVLNGATMAGDVVEFDNFTVKIPDEILVEGNNA